MAFAQFEDLSGNAELIIFPSTFAKVEILLGSHHVFVIKGTLDITAQNTCKIKVNELIPAETLSTDLSLIKTVTLGLPDVVTETLLASVKETLPPGSIPLQLTFKENDQQLLLMTSQKITPTMELFQDFSTRGIKLLVGI